MKHRKGWLVTVKVDRNPNHDPANKQIGMCPVSEGTCSDLTGQHHTFMVDDDQDMLLLHAIKGVHVTRVESVTIMTAEEVRDRLLGAPVTLPDIALNMMRDTFAANDTV